MKLAELKAAVYQLAQVNTTKQLKAHYKSIKTLDLRYKVSWEKALAQLRSGTERPATDQPITTATTAKKRKEKLAQKRAKTKVGKSVAQQPTKKKTTDATSPESFTDWLSHPPSEFSELFSAADTALESFEQKLAQGKQLTKNAITMASSLDEFAEATVDEAKRLARAAKQTIDSSNEADLN